MIREWIIRFRYIWWSRLYKRNQHANAIRTGCCRTSKCKTRPGRQRFSTQLGQLLQFTSTAPVGSFAKRIGWVRSKRSSPFERFKLNISSDYLPKHSESHGARACPRPISSYSLHHLWKDVLQFNPNLRPRDQGLETAHAPRPAAIYWDQAEAYARFHRRDSRSEGLTCLPRWGETLRSS